MRKVIVFALLLVLVAGLAVPVFAAQDDLSMPDVSIQAEETVYLTVTLNKKVTGDTIGVTYTYDDSVLTPAPEVSQWLQKGTLQDFAASGNNGVWAVDKAGAITGDICTLAFRVREDATFTQTKVGCTLLVKKGDKKVGEYTAEATVTMTCNHSYGPWNQQGNAGHTRVCEKCARQQTQTHNWDEGVVAVDPNNSAQNLKTRTCTDCGAKITESVPAEGNLPGQPKPEDSKEPEDEQETQDAPWRPDPNETTFPDKNRPEETTDPDQITESTRPGQEYDHTETGDREESQENSEPTIQQPQDYNAPDEEEAYDPSREDEDRPAAIPVNGDSTQQEEDSHEDHAYTQEPNNVTVIVVCAVVLVVGAVIYLKKKRIIK